MVDDSLDEENREDETLDDEMEDDGFEEPILEGDIMEWCPTCKDIEPHVQVGENVDRLKCAICNHEHIREETPEPVVQSLLSDEDLSTPENLRAAWQRLTEGAEGEAYAIRIRPQVGDIVRHSKFGIGIVTQLSDATKAEMLFEDGLRRLVCGK